MGRPAHRRAWRRQGDRARHRRRTQTREGHPTARRYADAPARRYPDAPARRNPYTRSRGHRAAQRRRCGRADGRGRRTETHRRANGERDSAGCLPDGRRARRRQQTERIQIGVPGAGLPHPEMQVRGRGRAPAAGAHGRDPLPEPDPIALANRGGGEVQVGGVEAPITRTHGEREPRRSRCAREAHDTLHRRKDRRATWRSYVDPAVLTPGICVRDVVKGRDDLPRDRPGPACVSLRGTGLGKSGAQRHSQDEEGLHGGKVADPFGHAGHRRRAAANGLPVGVEASHAVTVV